MLRAALGILLVAAWSAAETPHRTYTYARAGILKLRLDLYPPTRGEPPHPLIVWIHGGGWRGGSRTDEIAALALRDSGFAVASIDYRLSPQALWPAQIHDAKAAVRWLRANADPLGLDTSRFIAWGVSAGGHLAALLGTTGPGDGLEPPGGYAPDAGSHVHGVIDFYGPTNFLQPVPRRLERWSSVGQLLGCAVPKCPDRARAASPLTYAGPGDAPFLIVHGTADSTVPYAQSAQLEAALRQAGVPVRLVTVDADHGGPAFSSPEVAVEIRDFLSRFTAGSGPLGGPMPVRSESRGPRPPSFGFVDRTRGG